MLITSGGDKDEVVGPGTEIGIQQAELFDPLFVMRKTDRGPVPSVARTVMVG